MDFKKIMYKQGLSFGLYYDSRHEIKAFEILEADPTVKRFGRCDFSVEYKILNFYNNEEVKGYWPDIFVEYTDGHIEIVEVKCPSFSLKAIMDDTCIDFYKFNAALDYCKSKNWLFILWIMDVMKFNFLQPYNSVKYYGKDAPKSLLR